MTEEYNPNHQASEQAAEVTETVASATEQEVTTEEDANTKQQVISVVNPTEDEMVAIRKSIVANYDSKVKAVPVIFNFKKSKDKASGIEIQRTPVHLAIPYPTVEGLIDIIEAKHLKEGEANKGLELLLEAMETIVNAAARDLLYEDHTLNAATFPSEKLAWEVLANIPKVVRRGSGIPKETWENFATDYIACMPAKTGKNIEQVTNAAKLFLNKFTSIKTSIDVLKVLQEQLALYADASENMQEFEGCVAFLLKKADDLINTKPEDLLANL